MIDLKEVLFKRYCDQKIAHFYILNAPSNVELPHEFLDRWVHEFLSEVLKKERGITQKEIDNIFSMGHSDILEIKKENPSEKYVVEDFSEFLHFQNYYNFELPHRFVVIHNAQNITTTIANKLLKTLEEPRPGTTIFFLNSSNQSFLPTIESRAISLTLRADKSELIEENEFVTSETKVKWFESKIDKLEFSDTLKQALLQFIHGNCGPSDVTSLLQTDKNGQRNLISLLMDYERTRNTDLLSKQKMLEEIRWFETSQTFNNPAWERFLVPLLNARK